MKTRKVLRIASVIMIAAMIGLMANQYAMAQDAEAEDTDPVVEFNTGQSATVILLGIGAGTLAAYQGYRTTKADWDTLKFFDGLIMSVLGSVPLAITAAVINTQLDLFGYVLIFFAALGIGNQITKTRKTTIPSNTE